MFLTSSTSTGKHVILNILGRDLRNGGFSQRVAHTKGLEREHKYSSAAPVYRGDPKIRFFIGFIQVILWWIYCPIKMLSIRYLERKICSTSFEDVWLKKISCYLGTFSLGVLIWTTSISVDIFPLKNGYFFYRTFLFSIWDLVLKSLILIFWIPIFFFANSFIQFCYSILALGPCSFYDCGQGI